MATVEGGKQLDEPKLKFNSSATYGQLFSFLSIVGDPIRLSHLEIAEQARAEINALQSTLLVSCEKHTENERLDPADRSMAKRFCILAQPGGATSTLAKHARGIFSNICRILGEAAERRSMKL